MRNDSLNNCGNRNRPGVVLLVTLVLLVVLATLGYTLSSRVAAQRHRDQYIIDYSQARYACDSASKYAFATLQDLDPQLISRPNEPDFSDLFVLSEAEYKELLTQWAAENASETEGIFGDIERIDSINNIDNVADINDINDVDADEFGITDLDVGSLTIPGPYGPPWPLVTDPVEFEIGSATVRIEIEDENAKYPIGWMLLNEPEVQREAQAGFEMFCEWMGIEVGQIDSLKDQLKQVGEIKPFSLEFQPITKTVTITPATKPTTTSTKTSDRSIRRTYRTQVTKKTISASDQMVRQNADFAQLFHSSLIDTELLARPYIEGRKESALKYVGMWASPKVNINTAPRHVLEAAFAFGGPSDAPKIAEEIIQRRRNSPFANIEDLKRDLLRHSDLIGKCEKYITTVSTFFTIRVTAVSGVAKASATIAITKDGQKVNRIAVISG